jgi:hypothetical protein
MSLLGLLFLNFIFATGLGLAILWLALLVLGLTLLVTKLRSLAFIKVEESL